MSIQNKHRVRTAHLNRTNGVRCTVYGVRCTVYKLNNVTIGKYAMAVGIRLGSITDEIGTSDFFHAFFSTTSGNLEPNGWGSRFPVFMKKLYSGEISDVDALLALHELDQISLELSAIKPNKVIWDIEDRSKNPPWGNNISPEITDLSNYFWTSTGRDLIETLREVLEELRDRGGVAKVVMI